MICGSCAMRMDGAAVLACKTRMYDIAQSGHVPVVSAMGNLPIVKDLVVDMEPFWAKYRAVDPYLQPGYDEPPGGREHRHPAGTNERRSTRSRSASTAAAACSECNAMESDPDFLGPQALAKAMRFAGDPRDGAKLERLELVNGKNGIWQCTRCYFCNERCPKGVDPRDAIAKLGAESIKEGIDRDMGAKHAKWFVRSALTTGWLRETELVPKTQGDRRVDSADEVRAEARARGQGPGAVSAARGEGRQGGAARSTSSCGAGPQRLRGDRPGREGARDARARTGRANATRTARARSRGRCRARRSRGAEGRGEEGRVLQGLPRVAVGEGARLLDEGARAEGRARARWSSSRSRAAARATSTRPSPTTTCT